MPTATFVLGLCGSGKSWHADRIQADVKCHEGFWLRDRKAANLAAVAATLRGGGDIVVTEIAFCCEPARRELVSLLRAIPNVTVRWVCIENNLEQANANCRQRQAHGDARVQIEINTKLSPNYTYPGEAEVLPMWSFSGSAEPT